MKTSKKLQILRGISIFLIGFVFAYLLFLYQFDLESFHSYEIVSPPDFVKDKQILVYEDRVVLNIEGARLTRYAPTKSMVPVLDSGANGISVKPKDENEIEIGDIISFWREGNLIVHRVVEKGVDENGAYFVTKGDNSPVVDGKTRFSEVEHKLVGLFY